MNLKEAFRYQNKLQSFLDEAQSILDRDANITKIENTYLRRKVMAEAEDETVVPVPETEYYEQITDIARFLLHLLGEKETLSAAIRTAKDALDIDMDSEVSLNAARQSVARTFRHMNDLRCCERTIPNGSVPGRYVPVFPVYAVNASAKLAFTSKGGVYATSDVTRHRSILAEVASARRSTCVRAARMTFRSQLIAVTLHLL